MLSKNKNKKIIPINTKIYRIVAYISEQGKYDIYEKIVMVV